MLKQLQAVCRFLEASQQALGAGHPSIVEMRQNQLQHLKTSFNATQPTFEDSANTLEALAKPMSCFTDAQRRELSEIVASLADARDTTGAAAPSTIIKRAKVQTHLHMFNYLTASEWDTLQSTCTMDRKIHTMIDRCLAIGLANPSEPTVASIIATIEVASGTSPFADHDFQLIKVLRGRWGAQCHV